jgi:hypothetical protein
MIIIKIFRERDWYGPIVNALIAIIMVGAYSFRYPQDFVINHKICILIAITIILISNLLYEFYIEDDIRNRNNGILPLSHQLAQATRCAFDIACYVLAFGFIDLIK